VRPPAVKPLRGLPIYDQASVNFPLAGRYVDRVILVTDDEIRVAQEALWARTRLVPEPGGAAAFAALLGGYYQPRQGERVGVILCGGNSSAVDFDR
jgi:threonine dehydratase